MLRTLDPAAVRAYVDRNRALVEEKKREHWARIYRQRGGQSTMAAGHELYEHARQVLPAFPTERDRADDLAHQIALKRLIERAARAFTVR